MVPELNRRMRRLAHLRDWLAAADDAGETESHRQAQAMAPELVELLGRVVVEVWHAFLVDDVPQVLREAVQAVRDEAEPIPEEHRLPPAEKAKVLRLAVRAGVVSLMRLSEVLSRLAHNELLTAYCRAWAMEFFRSYFLSRQASFGEVPNAHRSFFSRHSPQERFMRQCGRLVVDAMRDFFWRAMWAGGLESGPLQRLVDAFAAALSSHPDVSVRLEQSLVPPMDRLPDVPDIERSVFFMTYLTLQLNTQLHNPNRGHGPQSSVRVFASMGRRVPGFQEPFSKKVYDLVRREPLGASSPSRPVGMIVTLHVSPQVTGRLTVACTDLGGAEHALLDVDPTTETRGDLERQLHESLGPCGPSHLTLLLPDGRTLSESQDGALLTELIHA